MVDRQSSRKCPKCKNPLRITAVYENWEDTGENITLEVECTKCGDRRVGELDESQFGEELKRLITCMGN